MMITREDVEYIAGLSRIRLKDKEIGPLTKNLEKILHYINKLERLDISNIGPTSHVLPLKNVYREDKTSPPLGQKDALKISVEQHQGFFKVPKVIE